MPFYLYNSDKPQYKFKVQHFNKNIYFGDSNYTDYLQLNKIKSDEAELKKNYYIKRHSAREDWNDPLTKGFWSRWILWNQSTLKKSILYIKQKFKIDLIDKTI